MLHASISGLIPLNKGWWVGVIWRESCRCGYDYRGAGLGLDSTGIDHGLVRCKYKGIKNKESSGTLLI